jgi:HTH-type transcriptional regulator, sugar sensing transcriptional regulator
MKFPPNNLLIKSLLEYGLTDREAVVYLSLLELEVASANEIAKNAGIKRSSAYVVLEALKKKGLVGVSEDQKIQEYVATSPEALLYAIESEVREKEATKTKIEKILPELKALSKDVKEKPKVKVFEGKQGLINALEESLKSKEKIIRLFSSAENALKLNPEYWLLYGQKRIELGIKQLGIMADNPAAYELFKMGPKMFELIFIPPNKYPFPVGMMITDNKLGYLLSDKDDITTVIIENKQIAEVMKVLFDMAWKESERKGKKVKQ